MEQSDSSPVEPAALTDEQIDRIAENCVKSMDGGIQGFCKTWGWHQFARELLDVCAGHVRATPSGTAAAPASAALRDIVARMQVIAPYTSFLGAYEMEWQDLFKAAAIASAQPASEAAGVADLARALVAKLDVVDPYMTSVFAMAQIRGCVYSGPTYGAELEALRAALATHPVRSAGG